MRARTFLAEATFLALLAGVVGCGSGGSKVPLSGSGDGGAGPMYTQVAQVSIGPFTLNPNQEVTYCITKKLPTTAPLDIARISTTLERGSHHLIFYKSADTQESPTPTACQPFVGLIGGTVPLLIAESEQSTLDFPPGVAYQLDAAQMYRLESHYINTTNAPLTAMGTVNLYTYANPQAVTDHANLLLYGETKISIPAGQMATVGPTFFKVPSGAKVFGLTTHTHRLGIDASVDLASSTTNVVMPLLDNTNWDAPPLKLFSPPLTFDTGQGFRFTCKYDNTTNQTVMFGESALNEMCFIWAYYYPTQGFILCGDGVLNANRCQ